MLFEISWNQCQFRTNIQQTLESLIVFLSSEYRPMKKVIGPLGKDERKGNSKTKYFSKVLRGTWPSHSRASGLSDQLKSGNWFIG